MGWTFYNSSGQRLQTFGFVAATQAEMEAGSSTTAYVTPGRTQYHPGVVKAWALITAAGSLAAPDYNIASVTDVGTGNRTIVFDTDFADVDYAPVSSQADGGSNVRTIRFYTFATGSISHDIIGTSAEAVDNITGSAFFGDQ